LVSPLALIVLAFLFPELALAGKKQIWDALAAADPHLLAELRDNGLTPLIYLQLLGQNQHQKLPPAFLREFHQDYASSLKTAARQEQAALQIIRSFNQAKVDFILLKGADLRLRVYQDQAQRPMCDLDTLISRDQLPLTRQTLAQLGYRLSPLLTDPRPGVRELFDHELMFEPSSGEGLAIDLHWEIRTVAGFYRLPFPVLRRRAVLADYQGLPIKLLSPEHLVIHLCLHMYGDRFDCRQVYYNDLQIVDLALALTRLSLNWPQFLKDVAMFQCQAPVLSVLQEMSNILPHAINLMVLSELARYRPKTAERILLSQKLGYFSNYFAAFSRNPCRYWLSYVASKLWPSRQYLAQASGTPSRIAYLKQFLGKIRSEPK